MHSVHSAASVTITDQELVAQCLAGRQTCFAALVERYQAAVLGLITRMVRDREMARDLTQETFLKTYTALEKYDPQYRFSTWVFRIATNLTIDHLRRRKPTFIPLTADEEEEGGLRIDRVADQRETPVEIMQRNQLESAYRQAFEKLPPAYRAVLAMRHGRQMEYEEISATLRLPLGTVKNRIFRAREMLRELMGLERDETLL